MKHLLLSLLLLASFPLRAQVQWHSPLNDSLPYVCGRAWNAETAKSFHRLPNRLHPAVSQNVWAQGSQSAGLYVKFFTNADEIRVRYTLKGATALPHMPATGVSGIDLYSTDCNGRTSWCEGQRSIGAQSQYVFRGLAYRNTHGRGNEYRLYLPLYNVVEHLEIGVPSSADFRFIAPSAERPVVVYGTSIAQGACASRPGMAWTNIVQRTLDLPLINLGFSGNGLLDSTLFRMMGETEAALFVIDCMPNMCGNRTSLIRPRLAHGVALLRQRSEAPILLVEHAGYPGGNMRPELRKSYEDANRELRAVYDSLRKTVKGLHYLSREELNLSDDAFTDGTHPSDLGMQQYAEACTKKISAILHPLADGKPYAPCRQRREPDTYEWNERHEAVLRRNREVQPEVALIGNSITHYWGGEPYHPRRTAPKVWNKLFKRRRVVNMGFGWDRIENVLWRMRHGELDGIAAKKLFLLVGTNNLPDDPDERIAAGIVQLAEEAATRQPGAEIYVWGILPRRGYEERVRAVNKKVRESVKRHPRMHWLDAGTELSLPDGKVNETLFRDGLHPNAEGYERLARILKECL